MFYIADSKWHWKWQFHCLKNSCYKGWENWLVPGTKDDTYLFYYPLKASLYLMWNNHFFSLVFNFIVCYYFLIHFFFFQGLLWKACIFDSVGAVEWRNICMCSIWCICYLLFLLEKCIFYINRYFCIYFALFCLQIYTFGPTFRAENSNTSRHLAEFWVQRLFEYYIFSLSFKWTRSC